MTTYLMKEEICRQMEQAADELSFFCHMLRDDEFYYQPADKWSVAQNVTHLFISVKTTILAFRLPKFLVRVYSGKPNRPSKSYEELVAKYQHKLELGGKASGRFVPEKVPRERTDKGDIVNAFSSITSKLISIIENKWTDPELDQYLAPHPLLGKITLRELCYFTIHHTEHHLQSIKKIVGRSHV
jgi:hypothetical protein